MRTEWLSATQFAELVEIERQPANRLLRQFVCGRTKPWRGRVLVVDILLGQRGAGGRAYRVKVSSLPKELQDRLMGIEGPFKLSLPAIVPDANASKLRIEATFWLNVLREPLAANVGKDRSAAIKQLVGSKIVLPSGEVTTLSRATIYRKLQNIEEQGVAAAARKVRSDKRKSRVILAKDLDEVLRLNSETAEHVRETLRAHVKGWLVKGGTRSRILTHCSEHLKTLLCGVGHRPNDEQAFSAMCRRAVRRIYDEEYKSGQKVARHLWDRKRSDDDQPRVQRLAPQIPTECYVLDVHHVNVEVRGNNGKVGTIKMLTCMDWATGRVTADFIFFEERGGVRNIDNIELMRRVMSDPSWGVPQNFYIDNGKEYGFARFLDVMLRLNSEGQRSLAGRDARVINAIPYNASAKVVEAMFSRLNAHEFRHMVGFRGDDIVNPMQVAPGRKQKPHPSFDLAVEQLQGLIRAYNNEGQYSSEHLKGDSPNQRFERHVQNGWTATILDHQDFDGIFVERQSREVIQQAIRVKSRIWSHPALSAYLGTKIVACIPLYHGFNELRIEDLKGNFICIAQPNEKLAWNDERGARTSQSRKSARNKAIHQYKATAEKVDPLAERLRYGASHPDPQPNPVSGKISVNLDGPSAEAIVPNKEVRSRETTGEAYRLRQNELIEQLLRKNPKNGRQAS